MKLRKNAAHGLLLTSTPCLTKFPQDQIDFENDASHMVLEGYVLNHQALLDKHPGQCLREILLEAYQTGGMATALNLLRGSFLLAIHDKKANTAYIANDMLSKKPLFYLQSGEDVLVDGSFLSLVEDVRAAGQPLTIDPVGVSEMIQRCSFLGGDTYVQEIRFLERFQYLRIGPEGVSVESYAYHPALPCPDSEDELIDQIDSLFTEACAMAVQKNQQQGYQQVFTLSAGMDSRCAFLKSLPFCQEEATKPLCLCYGAKGCMELKIADQLAKGRNCELLTHEIDPVGFIRNREAILDRNEGMMYYAGTTGLTQVLRQVDTDRCGLVITGLGGGEIMGDLGQFGEDKELYQQLFTPLISDGAALRQRLDKLAALPYNEYVCYQDIRTCNNFSYTTRLDFETFSPFLYEDLFQLLLKVPQESKSFRRLYAKWYLKYIGDPTPTSCFQGPVEVTRRTAPKQLVKGVLRRLRRLLRVQDKWNMNPMETWVNGIPENRSYMEETLQADLAMIGSQLPQLAEQLQQQYNATDGDTKLRVLTVSGMVKRIL